MKKLFTGIGLLCCFIPGMARQRPPAAKPVIVITDLYYPYQDPGDNLDLIQGFASKEVNLLGVILDITDAFRKDTADHPVLWKDPRGPREAGIIPVEQMNYIFNRAVPYAAGPMQLMKSETDRMTDRPGFEQQGVLLLLRLLREAKEPVEVLSFGSARVLAVAFNRDSALLMRKIKTIHLSAGTASDHYALGSDAGANAIPGGEWNVALDVCAFTRLLRSPLPIALYPCAGKDGGFSKDVNDTFYYLEDLSFFREMDPRLQCYIDYAFDKKPPYDFLRAMDAPAPYAAGKKIQFDRFSVWESAIWLKVTGREIIKTGPGQYVLKPATAVTSSDHVIENALRPCRFTEIRDDGRFQFAYTRQPTHVRIYYRPDVEENEKAMNAVVPQLYRSYHP
ncbi:MAG TPA: hypothetical protein VGC22_03315 [Chitinophaga sp.]